MNKNQYKKQGKRTLGVFICFLFLMTSMTTMLSASSEKEQNMVKSFNMGSQTSESNQRLLPVEGYTMTNLGPDVYPKDINELGQIVGYVGSDAFLWLPEPAYGLLAGMNDIGPGEAYAINDLGQIVVQNGIQSYLWLPEPAYDLPAGRNDIVPIRNYFMDINNLGQVVGYYHMSEYNTGILWLPEPAYGLSAGLHEISYYSPEFLYEAIAWSINDLGQITITEDDAVEQPYTLVWDNGDFLPEEYPVCCYQAYDINEMGQIAGECKWFDYSEYDYYQTPAMWPNSITSTPVHIGPERIYSSWNYNNPTKINNLGQIIYRDKADTHDLYYLWEDSTSTELNDLLSPYSDWVIETGTDINDAEQIIGTGWDDGTFSGYVMTPIIPGIIESYPPDGDIDARIPHDRDDAGIIYGWDRVELTFNGDISSLTPADFTISEIGGNGVAPTVSAVNIISATTVEVVFSDMIEPGAWTVISHDASETSVHLGYLPGDVDSSGTSNANDITMLVDALNSIVTLPEYSTDINRSTASNANDIIELVDLLNGAGLYEPWYGVALP